MKRTVTVKLQLSKEQERILFELADTGAKVWNEVNYLRRRAFFEGKGVDYGTTEKIVYEKYKREIGSATVQQICRKNTESWRSFFALLKKSKSGKLPEWFGKPSPPGYRKGNKKRKPFIILRNDQYKIEGNRLILKGLGKFGKLGVQFKGRIHLKGKQGRLEIIYDDVKGKWYAHVSISKVEEKLEGGKWVSVPKTPKGNLTAGIDLGINNLMAVYVSDGHSFLVNGRPLKSIAFYWQRKIADYQSELNKNGKKSSKRLKKYHLKWKLQTRNYVNSSVRQVVRSLHDLGVSKIIVGYPKGIARNSGKGRRQNFLLSRVWLFSYIIQRLREVSEEYGIVVEVVDEAYTSLTCPFCGRSHYGARFVRGLYLCPQEGLVLNADLVGAFNILRKAVKTITPNLGGLLAQGRGNGGKTVPEGLYDPKVVTLVGETPQTSLALG
ncbi:transposase [Thermococcus sp. GR7]|uniref:RNA-guided endonuclease InsQ/TnpB family protein n=1 Tax=unclassified Thermococcus TaxID=2627626 RepID=UPI00142F5A01|nr:MULTISPECIES: RNA-guided endonuclease TnpB family protein [unclassified Thermococcus]NJE42574.1 transposase [Thermococcus sp. GR6]NJE46963.1 transposase [Thermococcus sp. GR7]NJE78985.1 transposase [Thermococcus sp. GR4]NJF22671.1 transposase [Thermococcus sp. GR5]